MAQVDSGLVAAFRAAGLDVNEMAGWQSRGESDGPFTVRAMILHHDAMGLHSNNVPGYMSQNGVDGAQLWIRFDGQVWILAAGRKWHAGLGDGWGVIPADSGNSVAVGVETDYSGSGPWPAALLAAIDGVTRVIVRYYGLNPSTAICGHKEYAPTRKPDPGNFDCNAWRARMQSNPPVANWLDTVNYAGFVSAVEQAVG